MAYSFSSPDVNEASSGFNVRGGSADQNLVLLDDAIVYNTSHAFGFFSVFNPDAVKEFELFKGGIAANYGGRLSSVLDVKQKEGNRKNFSGAASIGTILARVTAEGPFGKKESDGARGSYIISARRSYADLFLKAGVINNLKDATLYFYDLNVKANYK
ncbi:MAG: TonB-dependent receptor plug domain-containing protein, partial [Flammeovirgaceae bacterium]